MKIALIVLLCIIASIFLFLLPFIVYDIVLLIRRPVRGLYKKISSQDDYIPLDRIPKRFTKLLLLLEDVNFYKHHGVRPRAIKGSIRINFHQKKIVTGGSTITQQLMKNLYFSSFKKSYLRKIAEALLALWTEIVLTKEEILSLYINIIYFGNGIYGAPDAARFYFNKEISDLTMNQMFLMASIPTAPTRGNPIQYPEVFERLRNRDLDFFVESGQLTPEDREIILSHDASCLDEELRKPDDYTDNYPQYIVMENERYGPKHI